MKELDKFEAHARRGPKREMHEMLLASKLVAANRTDSLQRIRYLCEAYWFASRMQRLKDVDKEKVEVLNRVSQALKNARFVRRWINGRSFCDLIPVKWGFTETEESYKRFIRPWQKGDISFYSDFIKYHRRPAVKILHGRTDHYTTCKFVVIIVEPEDWNDKDLIKKLIEEEYGENPICPKCNKKIKLDKLEYEAYSVVDSSPKWSFFFEISGYLSEEGYTQLINSFVSWADPFVSLMEAELSKLISPRAFMDIYKTGEIFKEEKKEETSPGNKMESRE